MRIDRTNVGQIMEPRSKPNLRAVAEDGNLGSDEVVVSPQLQEKLASASQQETAKAERINALKVEIQSGEYKIDFGKLASKLIDEESYKR